MEEEQHILLQFRSLDPVIKFLSLEKKKVDIGKLAPMMLRESDSNKKNLPHPGCLSTQFPNSVLLHWPQSAISELRPSCVPGQSTPASSKLTVSQKAEGLTISAHKRSVLTAGTRSPVISSFHAPKSGELLMSQEMANTTELLLTVP